VTCIDMGKQSVLLVWLVLAASRGETRGGCERETLDDFFVKLETDG